MSRTNYIDYKNNGFWTYDVSKSILLKFAIDAAETIISENDWLSEVLLDWKIQATVPDFGMTLKNDWSDYQVDIIISIFNSACCKLQNIKAITSEEMNAWDILDGRGVNSWGASTILTDPIIELGVAIQLLLSGKLPSAPDGTWWFYGCETGRSIIKKLS